MRRRTHGEASQESPCLLERLEPRVLLSGDFIGVPSLGVFHSPIEESAPLLSISGEEGNEPAQGTVTPLAHHNFDRILVAASGEIEDDGGLMPGPEDRGAGSSDAPTPPQIVFVDAAVPDSETLLRAVSFCGPALTQLVYLDADRNGIEQITEVLADHRNLPAIHIFSHGASGSLALGNALLDARTIEEYADLLGDWGGAIAEEGDILLYGCSVAEGDVGVGFLERLGLLTGADIAASDDPTGDAALRGDWDLEFIRGAVEALPAFHTSAPRGYAHVLMFTLAVLPDTQKYAEQQLQPFLDQTQWIADHALSDNIAFVSHVGDVVENGALYESEWVFADAAMDILDGTSIPYSVLLGNHDYDVPGTHSTTYRFTGLDAEGNVDPQFADKSFGPSRYAGESWFIGASDDALNYCQLFTADEQDYLHLALEWEPRPSSVEWAQQQIDAYSQLPVILSTHYYIDPLVDGHFTTTYSDDGYSGEELFQALVYPNPQIFMVLSGHNTEWHQVSTNEAGLDVLEMMADYQSRPNGGNGWMQLIGFDPDLNHIDVRTYSPTLDQFELDSTSQFSFDFDFDERFNFILAPMATLVEPMDQGPNDGNPVYDAATVNVAQPRFQVQLIDADDGVDDTTVTSETVAITKDGVVLTESVDYSFSYDPSTDLITLTPTGDSFGDGLYEITLNGGGARIADPAGHELATTLLTVEIDTSIVIPQTVTFQQGVNGYAGTVDTEVRGSAPDADLSTATSIMVDGENGKYPVQALLRFENIFGTNPGQVPLDLQIISAQLEIAFSDGGDGFEFHRMLRSWVESETWNTLGTGIQADDVEAAGAIDGSIAAVGSNTFSIDVTTSLRTWQDNPMANLGWALLPLGLNGVSFDSSEGTAAPRLLVTFGGPKVDATAPSATLVAPLDQGPNDHDPTDGAALVNTTQAHFQVQLDDEGLGIDDATVTHQTVALHKDGAALTESIDYSFSYDSSTRVITLTPAEGAFDNGVYEITLNGDDGEIADLAGNSLPVTTFTVEVDTSISAPQTVVFQQGINGYAGTVDTDVRGSAPNTEYSTSTSIRVDGESSSFPIHGLLRFDDIFGSGPGQIPMGAQITSAQLEVAVTDNGNALTFHRMLRNWVETETWNTLVAGIQANDIEALSTADASTGEMAVGTLSVDVTPSLTAWGNAPSANFGWTLLPTGSNGVIFDSSEGVTPPRLVVTFVTSSTNDLPSVSLENTITTLAENADTTIRLKVADIVVTDDASGTNLLSVSGADASLFEIDGSELYLVAGATLDYETNPVLDVTVEVDDATVGGTPDDTADLSIAVTDMNEAPTVALANTTTSLAENTDTSVRLKVADIVVTDDALGTNVLSLSGVDASLFEIDGGELYLIGGAILDYETNPVLDVTVEVDDPAIGTVSAELTDLQAVLERDAPAGTPTINVILGVDNTGSQELTGAMAVFQVLDDEGEIIAETMTGVPVLGSGESTTVVASFGMSWSSLPGYRVAAYVTFDAGAAPPLISDIVDHASPRVSVDRLLTSDPTPALTGTVDDPTAVLAVTVQDHPYVATNTGDGTWILEAGMITPGLSEGVYDVVVTATDIAGNVGVDTSTNDLIIIDSSQLQVALLEVETSGLTVYLTRPIDISVLNLYDNQANAYGPADLTVVGETVGTVTGSLICDPETGTVAFVKTGGPLEPDTYTLTLRGAADGFTDSEGNPLDGDADGIPGGDYVTTFVVESSTARLLSLPDFTRGPGQVVNVPATGSGIPITVSEGMDVQAVDFVFEYDPEFLNVTGISRSGDLPADWSVVFGLGTPGRIPVTAYGSTSLPAGPVGLVDIQAAIPDNAEYAAAAVLSFRDIQVNGGAIATEGDSAVEVAAYLGDATGNHAYSALDAAYVARVGVGLDSGFVAAYRTKDPVLIGDVTGNGSISALDAAYIASEGVGLDVPEIPDLPDVLPPLAAGGQDPLLSTAVSILGAATDRTTVELYRVTAAVPDYGSDPQLDVKGDTDDTMVGSTPEDMANLSITVTDVNEAPSVALVNTTTALAEDTDTTARLKVADVVVTDDALGTNALTLSGTDAGLFEIDVSALYLKAGTLLDYETNPVLDVTVAVDDLEIGSAPEGSVALAITITDVLETTVYYVSQGGTGDGSAVEAPAGIASFNAGIAPFDVLDGLTVYFLGTITATINPSDGGTAESGVTLRGDYPGQEGTIAGAGTLAIGIDIGNDDHVSIIGFIVQSTTAYAISIGSEAVGTIIEGCTINQAAGRGIAFQSPVTITGNTLTATGGLESVYSSLGNAGGTVSITANTFNFNHAGPGLFIRGYGTHIITDNDINLSAGSAMVLDDYGTGSEAGSITFSGNDIDSSVAPSGPLISLTDGDWAVTISDNAFDLTSTIFGQDVIYLSGQAGPLVSQNTIHVADDTPCVHLDGDGRGAVATIAHNTLTHTGGAGAGYIVRVGHESAGPDDNTYDGIVITDNQIAGFDPLGSCHAIFVGFNRNAVIARNHIRGAGYGVVVKGSVGTGYTAGGVMYNVIYNCDIALRIKGVDDVVIVNNTVYSPHPLVITGNVGGDESTGIVLKNNILSGTGGSLLQIGSETDLSTISTADYATNCLYAYPPGDYVKYRGISYTYAEWVALGYDGGSVNADPQFVDRATGDLRVQLGSPCIDAGTNLGATYDDGIAPTSVWPLSLITLDQDEYGSGWEIGAYVFDKTVS